MTQGEFKAWFEGYAEGIIMAPNEKQWERIKAKVASIDGIEALLMGPAAARSIMANNTHWSVAEAFAALGRSEAFGDASCLKDA